MELALLGPITVAGTFSMVEKNQQVGNAASRTVAMQMEFKDMIDLAHWANAAQTVQLSHQLALLRTKLELATPCDATATSQPTVQPRQKAKTAR